MNHEMKQDQTRAETPAPTPAPGDPAGALAREVEAYFGEMESRGSVDPKYLAAHAATPGHGAKHPDDWCMHRAERDRLREEIAALKKGPGAGDHLDGMRRAFKHLNAIYCADTDLGDPPVGTPPWVHAALDGDGVRAARYLDADPDVKRWTDDRGEQVRRLKAERADLRDRLNAIQRALVTANPARTFDPVQPTNETGAIESTRAAASPEAGTGGTRHTLTRAEVESVIGPLGALTALDALKEEVRERRMAHDDRATLRTLVEEERARTQKVEAERDNAEREREHADIMYGKVSVALIAAGVSGSLTNVEGVKALAAERDALRTELAALKSAPPAPTWVEVQAAAREILDSLMTIRTHNDRLSWNAPEDGAVRDLCERHGYGAVMSAASRLWGRLCREKGHAGGEFVVGPCAGVILRDIARLQTALTALGTAPAPAQAGDPRLRLPFLLEACEESHVGWEPAEALCDRETAELRRAGYECPTRVRELSTAPAPSTVVARRGGAQVEVGTLKVGTLIDISGKVWVVSSHGGSGTYIDPVNHECETDWLGGDAKVTPLTLTLSEGPGEAGEVAAKIAIISGIGKALSEAGATDMDRSFEDAVRVLAAERDRLRADLAAAEARLAALDGPKQQACGHPWRRVREIEEGVTYECMECALAAEKARAEKAEASVAAYEGRREQDPTLPPPPGFVEEIAHENALAEMERAQTALATERTAHEQTRAALEKSSKEATSYHNLAERNGQACDEARAERDQFKADADKMRVSLADERKAHEGTRAALETWRDKRGCEEQERDRLRMEREEALAELAAAQKRVAALEADPRLGLRWGLRSMGHVFGPDGQGVLMAAYRHETIARERAKETPASEAIDLSAAPPSQGVRLLYPDATVNAADPPKQEPAAKAGESATDKIARLQLKADLTHEMLRPYWWQCEKCGGMGRDLCADEASERAETCDRCDGSGFVGEKPKQATPPVPPASDPVRAAAESFYEAVSRFFAGRFGRDLVAVRERPVLHESDHMRAVAEVGHALQIALRVALSAGPVAPAPAQPPRTGATGGDLEQRMSEIERRVAVLERGGQVY